MHKGAGQEKGKGGGKGVNGVCARACACARAIFVGGGEKFVRTFRTILLHFINHITRRGVNQMAGSVPVQLG